MSLNQHAAQLNAMTMELTLARHRGHEAGSALSMAAEVSMRRGASAGVHVSVRARRRSVCYTCALALACAKPLPCLAWALGGSMQQAFALLACAHDCSGLRHARPPAQSPVRATALVSASHGACSIPCACGCSGSRHATAPAQSHVRAAALL
eukprot:359650-Chlamydomonas_euryale.AAC.14